MKPYTLVGVDGNAFAVIGYTTRAMKRAGMVDKVDEMRREAMSDDYFHLINVCDRYIDMVNEALGLEEDWEEEE